MASEQYECKTDETYMIVGMDTKTLGQNILNGCLKWWTMGFSNTYFKIFFPISDHKINVSVFTLSTMLLMLLIAFPFISLAYGIEIFFF